MVPSEEGLAQAFDYADVSHHRPWRHKWDAKFANDEQLTITKRGPYNHLMFHRARVAQDQVFTKNVALVSVKSKVVEDHNRIELVPQSVTNQLDQNNRESDSDSAHKNNPAISEPRYSIVSVADDSSPSDPPPQYASRSVHTNRESLSDDIARLLDCYIHDSTLGEDFRKSIVSLIGLNASEPSSATSTSPQSPRREARRFSRLGAPPQKQFGRRKRTQRDP